jgi:hypothetical protein
MHKKHLVRGLAFTLLLASFLSVFSVMPVNAVSDIMIFNPSTGNGNFIFDTSTAPLGSKFNITVIIDSGTGVAAWQVRLAYNATLLNATRAWVPLSDAQYIFFGLSTFTPPAFFEPGRVKIGDTTTPITSVSFASPKRLCIVEFKVVKAPVEGAGNKLSDTLFVDDPDTYILDTSLMEMASVKTNGYYELSWAQPMPNVLLVRPPLSPNLFLGQVFIVGVDVIDVTNLYAYEFKLLWNTTLLDLVGVNVTVPSLWGTNYIIAQNRTDQDLGEYWLGVSAIYPAHAFHGNATLVWLTFKVSYAGNASEVYGQTFATVLKLSDTILIDDQGADVQHRVIDCALNIEIHFVADIIGPNNTAPDGKVDIRDVAFPALRFGANLGDPRFDPRADITGPTSLMPDGKIDIRDIALVALHFGENIV